MDPYGPRGYIRSDNGSEFIAKKIKEYTEDHPIKMIDIDPGNPWQKGSVESFHQGLRDECLNQELFLRISQAQGIIEDGHKHDKALDPHSHLNGQSPHEDSLKALPAFSSSSPRGDVGNERSDIAFASASSPSDK